MKEATFASSSQIDFLPAPPEPLRHLPRLSIPASPPTLTPRVSTPPLLMPSPLQTHLPRINSGAPYNYEDLLHRSHPPTLPNLVYSGPDPFSPQVPHRPTVIPKCEDGDSENRGSTGRFRPPPFFKTVLHLRKRLFELGGKTIGFDEPPTDKKTLKVWRVMEKYNTTYVSNIPVWK